MLQSLVISLQSIEIYLRPIHLRLESPMVASVAVVREITSPNLDDSDGRSATARLAFPSQNATTTTQT